MRKIENSFCQVSFGRRNLLNLLFFLIVVSVFSLVLWGRVFYVGLLIYSLYIFPWEYLRTSAVLTMYHKIFWLLYAALQPLIALLLLNPNSWLAGIFN